MRKIALICAVCLCFVAILSCTVDSGTVAEFRQGESPTSGYAGSSDTHIYEGQPTINSGASDRMTVGDVGFMFYSMIRFDIDGFLPAGAIVKSAELTFAVSSAPDPDFGINAHELTMVFSESGATWNINNNQYSATVIGSSTIQQGATSFSIPLDPAVVQKWIDNPLTNYGILLRDPDSGPNKWVFFYTKENATGASLCPGLRIVYE